MAASALGSAMVAPAGDATPEYFCTLAVEDIEMTTIRLGRGSFGDVFRCRLHGDVLAVKTVRFTSDTKDRQQAQEQLSREFDLLMKIPRHENIPRGALGSPSGAVNSGIEEWFQAQEMLDASADIIFGLSHLHSFDVFHRDLKPSNCLVECRTKHAFGRIVLTDFGTSIGTSDGTFRNTQVGTPAYMPPEMLEGAYKARAGDVFSLGVTLFELWSGLKIGSNSCPIDYDKDSGARHLPDVTLLSEQLEDLSQADVDLVLMTVQGHASLITRCCHRLPDQRPALNELLVAFTNTEASSLKDTVDAEDDSGLRATKVCGRIFDKYLRISVPAPDKTENEKLAFYGELLTYFNPWTTAIGGRNGTESCEFDEYQNPIGSKFDLGRDSAFSEFSVLVGQFFQRQKVQEGSLCYELPTKDFGENVLPALRQKGFTVVIVEDEAEFVSELSNRWYGCAWIVSSDVVSWRRRWCARSSGISYSDKDFDAEVASFANAIGNYNACGGGLFLWGANDPYHAHANVVLRVISESGSISAISGSVPGGNFLRARLYEPTSEDDNSKLQLQMSSGKIIDEDHLIFTGIRCLFEGQTIAGVHTDRSGMLPLVVGGHSEGTGGDNVLVISSAQFKDRGRLLFDTGLTKLWKDWKIGGTDRYVVNATVWLLGLEHRLLLGSPINGRLPSRESQQTTDRRLTPSIDPDELGQVLFIVDISASMQRDVARMRDWVKRQARLFMGIGVRCAVIFFESRAFVRQEFTTKISELDSAMDRPIRVGGTNYAPAFQCADELLQRQPPSSLRTLVLFQTDGSYTDTSTQPFVDICRSWPSKNILMWFIFVGSALPDYAGPAFRTFRQITDDCHHVLMQIRDYSELSASAAQFFDQIERPIDRAKPAYTIKLLQPGDIAFEAVELQFHKDWANDNHRRRFEQLRVEQIWEVDNQFLAQAFQKHCDTLRIPRRRNLWHGTSMACSVIDQCQCGSSACNLCSICQKGFLVERVDAKAWHRFGPGLYFAPNSSKAHDYAAGFAAKDSGRNFRVLILAQVAVGQPFETSDDISGLLKPPAGYDSWKSWAGS